MRLVIVADAAAQVLRVTVVEGRGLRACDANGLSDPYLKGYLVPDKKKATKQKTAVHKKTLNPVFNETLTWHLRDIEVRRGFFCAKAFLL